MKAKSLSRSALVLNLAKSKRAAELASDSVAADSASRLRFWSFEARSFASDTVAKTARIDSEDSINPLNASVKLACFSAEMPSAAKVNSKFYWLVSTILFCCLIFF